MKRLIVAVLMFLGSASVAAAETQMIELPVNAQVRALTYAYCLTGDRPGITHLLAERIAFASQASPAQARRAAEAWVADGFCADTLASAERAMPGARAAVTAALAEEGFNVTEPITQQAIQKDAESKGFFSWLGKAVKAVGKALGGMFSAGGSGHYEYYETGQVQVCDREWHVTVGGGGGGYEPTPFYPEGGPGER